jgi:DNA-binding transcriptional ArsR family regulator
VQIKTVTVLEALGDPIRGRIVELLAERDLAAGDIAQRFSVTRPAVSRHLRVLREAGLVNVRGEAQRRMYQLDPKRLVELVSWTQKLRTKWEARLDELGRHLDDLKAKEERT